MKKWWGWRVGAPFLPPAEHWEESQRPNRSDHFENQERGVDGEAEAKLGLERELRPRDCHEATAQLESRAAHGPSAWPVPLHPSLAVGTATQT